MLPALSPDRKSVYYLVKGGSSRAYVSGELWRADVATGSAERLFPGVIMTHFDLSPDSRRVLYAEAGVHGNPGLWIDDVDHCLPPRQLTSGGEYRAFFSADHEIVFYNPDPPRKLRRVRDDGTGHEIISNLEIIHLQSVSGDGRWAVVNKPASGDGTTVITAIPLRGGGEPVTMCDYCIAGFGPARVNAPVVMFSRDSKRLYAALNYFGFHSRKTVILPFNGKPFNLTPKGPRQDKDFAALPGARLVDRMNVFPGLDMDTYVYTRTTALTNIYRLLLPD